MDDLAQKSIELQRHPVDGRHLRSLLGNYLTGVTIVTAAGRSGPVGTTVNSFTSVSLDPPLVLFCLHTDSTVLAEVAAANGFAINILNQYQSELCRRFARRSSATFTGVPLLENTDGPPVFAEAIAYLSCDLVARHPGGDHEILIGRVRDLAVLRGDTAPLAFFRGAHPRVDLRWAEEIAYWPGD